MQSIYKTLQSVKSRAPAVIEAHFFLLFTLFFRCMNNIKGKIGLIAICLKQSLYLHAFGHRFEVGGRKYSFQLNNDCVYTFRNEFASIWHWHNILPFSTNFKAMFHYFDLHSLWRPPLNNMFGSGPGLPN